MNITFDSNVWEKIVHPEGNSEEHQVLNEQVSSGRIQPYICEIALSLESITRKERFSFWKDYKQIIRIQENGSKVNSNGTTTITNTMCFTPNNEAHPGLHHKLKFKLDLARKLGFKVLRMTNIGTVRSNEIPTEMLVHSKNLDDFWAYAHKLAECAEFIHDLEGGSFDYHQLVEKYGFKGSSFPHIMQNVNETQYKKFSNAVKEWVDGDSLSAHYAYGNDLFCSEDTAKGAGKRSIFSKSNLNKLEGRFGVKVVSLRELVNILL